MAFFTSDLQTVIVFLNKSLLDLYFLIKNIINKHMGRVKRIWYLSPMRAAKVQAQLKFVMMECSKTQIRLTGLIWYELI